jgi:hypothetical protein
VAPAPSTVIKLKRGTTTPTSANIESGEVAVDTSAQRLYINDNGVIKEIGGSTDLTSVGTNIIPNVDETYSLGSLTAAFKDFFYAGDIKQQVDIFTNSVGLGSPATQFAFRANTEKKIFTQVFTTSGGISTPALSNTTFDDNNPAYRF